MMAKSDKNAKTPSSERSTGSGLARMLVLITLPLLGFILGTNIIRHEAWEPRALVISTDCALGIIFAAILAAVVIWLYRAEAKIAKLEAKVAQLEQVDSEATS